MMDLQKKKKKKKKEKKKEKKEIPVPTWPEEGKQI